MELSEALKFLPINPNNFPSKLWHLVNDPCVSSICWDHDGEGILIFQWLFEAQVLWSATTNRQMDRYFKTTDFNSFLRQLNLYGFRKIHHGISNRSFLLHYYYNPNFKKANPELLVNLKRLTPANKAKFDTGLQEPSQSSRLMLNSPEKDSSVVDAHELHMTPKVSQAFVTGRGEPGSEFHHFQMDFPRAYPSHPMQLGSQWAVPAGISGTFVPHYSQYGFFPPVYKWCIPGALSSNTTYSYAHYGYYPEYSVLQPHFADQNPKWQADDDPDPRKRFMSQDTGNSSHLHFTGQKDSPGKADNQFLQSVHQ